MKKLTLGVLAFSAAVAAASNVMADEGIQRTQAMIENINSACPDVTHDAGIEMCVNEINEQVVDVYSRWAHNLNDFNNNGVPGNISRVFYDHVSSLRTSCAPLEEPADTRQKIANGQACISEIGNGVMNIPGIERDVSNLDIRRLREALTDIKLEISGN